MKLTAFILVFSLFTSGQIKCQTVNTDSTQSFKIQSATPTLKTLFSKSNTLYSCGSNPIILEGIDSGSISKYSLYYQVRSKCYPIYKMGNVFELMFYDGLTISNPVSLKVFICKIQSTDTIIIGSQNLNINTTRVCPSPKIMIGRKELTPNKEERKLLLKNPKLNLESQNQDYSPTLTISSFDIMIGGKIYHCNSSALSNDILEVLKNYKGDYISIRKIYVSSANLLAKPIKWDDISK